MKNFFIFLLMFLSFITQLYAFQNCREIISIGGEYYWYNSAVHGTSILSEENDDRIWYINPAPDVCYKSGQKQINNPAVIYSGYIMALKKLGDENSPGNLLKIKKLTGIIFNDSGQFNKWFDKNSSNFFWSFEKNMIVVLEDGFGCKQINPAKGKLYWFNYFLGSSKDLDTSPDKRLWRNMADNTKCFISPLTEINNRLTMLDGYELALSHVGASNNEMRIQIINRFNKININRLTETAY